MSNLKIGGIEDLDTIVEMCERFHENSVYADTDFSYSKVRDTIRTILLGDKTKGICILSENGMIIGVVSELLFGTDTISSELAWWVSPEARGTRQALKLIEAYEYWAKNIAKVSYCQMALLGEEPRLQKLYNRRGYKITEQAFMKEL